MLLLAKSDECQGQTGESAMILIAGMEPGNQSVCAQGWAICILIYLTHESLILYLVLDGLCYFAK